MIIGNGQLAKAFQKSKLKDDTCIFASGVSNSSCTDERQFEKRKKSFNRYFKIIVIKSLFI